MVLGYNKTEFFRQVKAEYAAKAIETKKKTGFTSGMPIITESSLRFEQFVSADTTRYEFPVLAGQSSVGTNNILATEVRLEQNDNFHIAQIGFYLGVTENQTDTNFRLQTNPNEIFLGGATEALDYLTIYNSLLNINVNQVDVLTNYRLSKHMVVNQTQRLASAVNNNFDQIDSEVDGLISLQPALMLSGAYTNKISITFPAAVTEALPDNNSRMIIIVDGLRAQNASIRKGALG